jgi:hypothetical protein
VLVDDRAVTIEMLIQCDTGRGTAQQGSERLLACLDWLASQIFVVQLKQIERAMHGRCQRAVATDQVEHRKSVLAADDRLAVDETGPRRQGCNGQGDEGEAVREVIARARDQPHTGLSAVSHEN